MGIEQIEQLVDIVREARISELAVTADGSTVRLRKPLPRVQPVTAPPAKSAPVQPSTVAPVELAVAEVLVAAPMVGIFHSAGNAMTKGMTVRAGQSIGAIESMKLMNDVISEHDGAIAEVLIEDGMPVEYGQPLFRLE